MSKEVLFTIAQDNRVNSTDTKAKLQSIQDKDFGRYYDQKFLDGYLHGLGDSNSPGSLNFNWYPYNAPGQWMAENIDNPSVVIPEPISWERMERELAQGDFSYVVVATYLSGYSTFREIAQQIHTRHPEVKVIAAAVGALLPESAQLADYVVCGDQVTDLRRIIGQPETDDLKPVVIRSDTTTTYEGCTKTAAYGLLVSSLGCMYGCDFCPSTAQFGQRYSAPFTAEEIKAAIVTGHSRIDPGSQVFTLSVAEPQGMGNVALWKEVLRSCRDLPFQCNLVTTTSSKVVQRYSFEELTTGALRLSTVNIGVESLLKGYQKNRDVDLKALTEQLQTAGINVVSTYIIGLDWQTKENIREEVKLLKDLGSSGYIVANLEMQPNSPLYNKYQSEGRLLEVPPELLAFYGYQAFIHQNFSEGFNDMLPLLGEVDNELSQGTSTLAAGLQVFLRGQSSVETATRETLSRMIDEYRLSLDPTMYPGGVDEAVAQFSAKLYYQLAFRQIDLFHPFILSTN